MVFFFSPVMSAASKSRIAGHRVIPSGNADETLCFLCSRFSLPSPRRGFARVIPRLGKKRLPPMKAKQCPLLSLLTLPLAPQQRWSCASIGALKDENGKYSAQGGGLWWGTHQVRYGLLGDKTHRVEWAGTAQLLHSCDL